MGMAPRTAQLMFGVVTLGLLLFVSGAWTSTQQHRRAPARPRAATKDVKSRTSPRLPCGGLLSFQVLLDRQGFSPGEIDGMTGANFTHALSAFQQARHLPMSGQPDCETWRAVGGDSAGSNDTGGNSAGPTTVSYTITAEDVKGPFTKTIPKDLVAQAALPALGYRSVLEKLGERFHTSPALLQRLNRGSRFAAGGVIQVPAVQPFDADAKPKVDPAAMDITIQVSRDESSLRATHADGTLAFFAPVTTGSEHDPLPTGDWKVTSVGWHPAFHYNPDLFWDAKATQTKATIKPGPNNPVGVVWIDLSLEHYGLHGTPEPGNIGHTESHGCVRLTNWDAARLVSLVKPGTPVLFR
jgi:lipoprotein-anchoring transpeptidase ErfK/SrfK